MFAITKIVLQPDLKFGFQYHDHRFKLNDINRNVNCRQQVTSFIDDFGKFKIE